MVLVNSSVDYKLSGKVRKKMPAASFGQSKYASNMKQWVVQVREETGMARMKALVGVIALIAMSGLFTLVPHTAALANSVTSDPNQHLWNIVQLDASGHAASKWTGSYTDFKKKIAQKLTASEQTQHSKVNPLINQVYDPACANRGDFYAFWNVGGSKICFANAGSTDLGGGFANVVVMNTGNNTGEFYDSSFYGYLCTPNPYTAYIPETGFRWTVTWVHIGGCPNTPYLIP